MNIEKGKKYITRQGLPVSLLGQTKQGWLVSVPVDSSLPDVIGDYWHVSSMGKSLSRGELFDVVEAPKVHTRYIVWYRKSAWPDIQTTIPFRSMSDAESFLRRPRLHPLVWSHIQEITVTEESKS
jgi:hypothetical protein